MAKSREMVEHMEHAGHGGGHGHDDEDGSRFSFNMLVGITMAVLGAFMAFAGAKVGGERTELVKTMVEQQHAHAKYQAQDIKHRTAVIALRQIHASIVPETAAKSGHPKSEDVLMIADTVERYLGESQVAKEWVEAFDPAITAHTNAQEHYEMAQLAAEFGIVIASLSLMLKHRAPWLLAVVLGVVCVGIIGVTFQHTGTIVHEAEAKIEETGHEYRELRTANKSTAADQALIDDVRALYGKKK